MIKQFYLKKNYSGISHLFAQSLNIKQLYFIHSSIWLIDRTLSATTTLDQSGPGSDVDEGVPCIPQTFSITGTSSLDCLVLHQVTCWVCLTRLQRYSRWILQPQPTRLTFVWVKLQYSLIKMAMQSFKLCFILFLRGNGFVVLAVFTNTGNQLLFLKPRGERELISRWDFTD